MSKSNEWEIIQSFRDVYADFPKGKLTKSESPDFTLSPARKQFIGIELTRVMPDYNEEEVEFWTPEGFYGKIKAAIEAKEIKLKSYQKNMFQTYWLIMSADHLNGIEALNIKNLTDNLRIRSDYNKIFLFLQNKNKVYEINPIHES